MKNELSPQAKSRQPPAPIPRRLLGRLALPLKLLVLSSSHSGTVSIHCTPACLRRLPSPRATCFMTTKQSQKLSGRFFTQGEFGLASKRYFGRFIHAAFRCKSIFCSAGIAAAVVER
jgi:hypothetical protein